MEPNRWKRILVSAAGIYIEMLIAMLCVPLWLLSHEGPMQTFWLTMIAICSINTLLINGNPLLRYDGYFVLSDLLQIPNLFSSSQIALSQRVAAFFTNSAQVGSKFGFLECYAVAARGYRLFVIGVILFLIYSFFNYYQLPQLGMSIATMLILMTFFVGWLNGSRKLMSVSFWNSLRVGRTVFVAGVMIGLLLLLLWLPIAARTFADGESELQGARYIYAPGVGRIHWLVTRDSEVFPDQLIGIIRNDELELEILRQRQLIDKLELLLSNQKLLQRQGSDNSREVELHGQSLTNAKRLLQQLSERKESLQLHSQFAGKLVALPFNREGHADPLNLSRVSSSLADENVGCVVERSEPLAAIVHPEALRIRLWVPENRINRISVGDHVKVIVSQATPDFVAGKVISIDTELERLPLHEDGLADNQSRKDVGVVVKLVETDLNFPLRSNARAVIYGKAQPVYRYLWQEFMATLDL